MELTSEITMKMTGNEAYNPIALRILESEVDVDTILDECPAYGIMHQGI